MASVSAEQALSELLSGNLRFIGGQRTAEKAGAARRAEVAAGQHPLAVVVGCSDSRVPPEIVFDQGLGDLFVVRSAGHVLGGVALGSIEYAVEHLHVPLILVLGHSGCGALKAALEGHEATGYLARVVEPLVSVAEEARRRGSDPLDHAVTLNVQRVMTQLQDDPRLGVLARSGSLKIAGARYDLHTGVVTLVSAGAAMLSPAAAEQPKTEARVAPTPAPLPVPPASASRPDIPVWPAQAKESPAPHVAAPPAPVVVPPEPEEKPHGKALLPKLLVALVGGNQVRLHNPNSYALYVGLRREAAGKDVEIEPQGTGTLSLPNGDYDLFYVCADRPTILCKGRRFHLRGSNVELQMPRRL